MHEHQPTYSYLNSVWQQFCRHPLGVFGLVVIAIYCLVGVYAPFLASSKPIAVYYDGEWFFPLFRYLLYTGFYTKNLDIFFNLLMLTLPVFGFAYYSFTKNRKKVFLLFLVVQFGLFLGIIFSKASDPAEDIALNSDRQAKISSRIKENQQPFSMPKALPNTSWQFDLEHMNDYAQLNLVLKYHLQQLEHERLSAYQEEYANRKSLHSHSDDVSKQIPSLWQIKKDQEDKQITRLQTNISQLKKELPGSENELMELLDQKNDSGNLKKQKRQWAAYQEAVAELDYIKQRQKWLIEQQSKIDFIMMPLFRPYHWEDDAGGEQSFNQVVKWWEITRVNRKDLMAALIFGVRISLVVGIVSVGIALIIGIPIGAVAGYYGGTLDIVISRLLEIWESMPTFFMLLLIVAMTQSKSIFLVISVIGFFGWTGFCRFTRGEFFKQRNLSYVEACRSLSFSDRYIIFSHILPNAIPPVLTLLPFAIMGAISSEAGLSFLGLGEEGSTSWGVLMDEGRNAFPGESYLLWPPAILLTILLIAIALVGDALRDAIDPKLHLKVDK